MPSDCGGVTIRSVTKTYRAGVGRARVREMLPWPLDATVRRAFPGWWSRDTFDALHDVSISIEPGSSVGIVGHNGAGKTTLLKIIAEVTAPTSGRVVVPGRVAALLDALVGFHPDLTGRENTYLLGAIHGISRAEMAPRIERILEFAEIGELTDTPVKRYSAGMTARLGFATVTALEPNLVLIDEILAVGDAGFQRKCIGWLDTYRSSGGTLLFVSHNLALVRNMTEKVVWLDHGRVVEEGPTAEILSRYAVALERRHLADPKQRQWRRTVKAMHGQQDSRWGAGGARLSEVHVGQPVGHGSRLTVSMRYENSSLDEAMFCVGFVDESEREVGAATSPVVGLPGPDGSLDCHIEPLPLRPGIYFPVAAIVSSDGNIQDRWKLDKAIVIEQNGQIEVDGFGPVHISAEWSSGQEGR